MERILKKPVKKTVVDIKYIYQIDQSGKIEDTAKKTVLAAANGSAIAVILPGKDKRKLQESFRLRGKPQLFIDSVFTVLLYLLIKIIKPKLSIIEVDIEYPGHTEIIEHMLEQLTLDIRLRWTLVGKTSKAHDIAYKVFRKKLRVGKVVKFSEVEKLAIKIAGGYLNTGLSPANRYSGPANKKRIAQKDKKVKK